MFCSSCGAKQQSSAPKFCSECGTRMANLNPETPKESAPKVAAKTNTLPKTNEFRNGVNPNMRGQGVRAELDVGNFRCLKDCNIHL